MNTVRRSLTVICAVFLLAALAVTAAAFEFSPVSDQAQILENAGFTWLDEPPQKFAINCFDVNPDGLIAIGTQKGETKIVAVYDSEGDCQYGFTFRDRGDFGLVWEGTDILVCSVRSDVAFRVSPTGEIKEILEITDTPENNDYWHKVVYANERTVGADRYCLRDDMGLLNYLGSSYSQLVRVHADGTEQLLYDVNAEQLVRRLTVIVCGILFVGTVFWALYRQFRKMKRES